MAINYIYPLTGESVKREPYRWVVYYKDGTKLEQFEVTAERGAIFHNSKEINTANVDELQILHDHFSPIYIKFPEGAVPVVWYRHTDMHETVVVPKQDGSGNEEMVRQWKVTVYCYGFKRDKHYWLVYLDEQGHITFSDDNELFLNKAMPVGVN